MSVLTDYYKDADPDRLAVLLDLWNYAKEQEPKATEGLSYGYPALKLNGRPLIGFSIAKHHMSVYPFSPKVIEQITPELKNYEYSKGLIRFTVKKPVTKKVISLLIELRKDMLSS
ncbi:TPA: DUF1801 domain-containing protein [Candidatus Saccharibacteria bacterium]|nr:DUF1801 domain-containing protein [Candidatus Saccharibacteria bacterium]HIO87536.1 DUF1801 domain-containing protein [Candidatus Saccharibacteria bacterium]